MLYNHFGGFYAQIDKQEDLKMYNSQNNKVIYKAYTI